MNKIQPNPKIGFNLCSAVPFETFIMKREKERGWGGKLNGKSGTKYACARLELFLSFCESFSCSKTVKFKKPMNHLIATTSQKPRVHGSTTQNLFFSSTKFLHVKNRVEPPMKRVFLFVYCL